MAAYEFRCDEHGIVTVRVPMSMVESTSSCPACGAPARRVYSAPQLAFGDATARRLIAAGEKSAHEPAVVTAPSGIPRSRPRRPTADPRTARLPKP